MYISIIGLLLGAVLLAVGYGKTGQRGRKRGFIIAGWIVLGIQIFPLTVALIGCLSGRVNWIEYKPTSWLFSEVESPGWISPPAEYEELVSRLEAGDLSAEQTDRLARVALAEYLRKDKPIFPVEIRAINGLRRLGRLTSEQQDQFFERLVDVNMQAKTPVSISEGIPVRIEIRPQGDWSGCGIWCAVEITGPSLSKRAVPRIRVGRASYLHVDEMEARLSPAPPGPLVLQGPTFVIWQAKADVENPGNQNVTCEATIRYFEGQPGENAASQPIHTLTKQLIASSEVVNAPSPVAAKLVTDPRATPQVLGPASGGGRLGASDRCRIACYSFHVVRGPTGNSLRMSVHIDNTQIGCAFDAVVNIEGINHDAGTICQPEGQSLEWILEAPYPQSEPETVTLTLTPNQQLASESVGLPEIWGEAIEIKDIPRSRPVIVRPYVIYRSVP